MLAEGHRRFSAGVFALWYPVTGDELSAGEGSGARRARSPCRSCSMSPWRCAGRSPGAALPARASCSSTPPWRLAKSLRDLLPELVERLRQGNGATAAVTVLAGEELSQ